MGIASYQHNFSSQAVTRCSRAWSATTRTISTPTEIPLPSKSSSTNGFAKAISRPSSPRPRPARVEIRSRIRQYVPARKLQLPSSPIRPNSTLTRPLTFAFTANRPDLEQSAFVAGPDSLWQTGPSTPDFAGTTISSCSIARRSSRGSRSRAISRPPDLVVHFSYDRVFQTPSFENILLSSSAAVESLDPANFLRLPVQPSEGNYYEGGLEQGVLGQGQARRQLFSPLRQQLCRRRSDRQHHHQLPHRIPKIHHLRCGRQNRTSRLARFSGFLSYSYEVGNAWFPVTGGLFLGDDAAAAATQLSGHFPDSQDQRNTGSRPRALPGRSAPLDCRRAFNTTPDCRSNSTAIPTQVLAAIRPASARIASTSIADASILRFR